MNSASFLQLIEKSPFGIYIVDADFKLRHVSEGAKKVFAQFEPMIGYDFPKIMHTIWPAHFAEEILEHFQHTLATGERYQAPTFVESRNDTNAVESYEWQLDRIPLLDGRDGVVCYFYDATNRQQEAETIRKREQYFRDMADAAPAMVWVTDAKHYCNFLSRGWVEHTGQPEEEGLGIGWLEMVHPDDRDQSAKIIMGSLDRRESFSHDYRLRTATGNYRWAIDSGRPKFDDEGNFQGYVGSVIDVHDRHQAEDSLRERARQLEQSESRMRLAAKSTGFGTYDLILGSEQGYESCGTGLEAPFITESEKGFVTSSTTEPEQGFVSSSTTGDSNQHIWSDELFEICGLASGATPDQETINELVHPEDRETFVAKVEQMLTPDGPDRHQMEMRIVRPGGEVRWVVDSGAVFRDGEGEQKRTVRVVGTVQDITDRKIFEESLKQAKHTAETANRSRGEFLANMSHEIRTPMAAILGHADILKDHLKDPDNVQLVDTIRRNGNFLLNIINDILDLSKIDAGKMEIEKKAVRPDAIVGDVRSLMDVRAVEKEVPLTVEFAGPIPEIIETDAIRLRQILLNLVGNAIKFTDKGAVKLVVRYETETLNFDIIDTGTGIPADKLQVLFEPFTQVDNSSTRSFGGTGLGLAICRRLAHALGGEIGVESTFGKGSRFTLSLNVKQAGQLIEPNLNTTKVADAQPENIQLNVNVLVVDDRRDIRYLAQHFIEKAGGRVFTATNGQEAIDSIASSQSPRIDLIVMDMQMPVMDGYEATAELRRRGCEIPIIALTANAMKSDRAECLAAGCTEYTSKPLDQHILIEMISRLTT